VPPCTMLNTVTVRSRSRTRGEHHLHARVACGARGVCAACAACVRAYS
jgi:hypothetical protein